MWTRSQQARLHEAGIKSLVCEVPSQADLTSSEMNDGWDGRRRTLMAKNNVSAMEPKYAAVKGSRGPEIRCLA